MGVGQLFRNVEYEMANEKIIGLIEKYLAGQCTPEEAFIVEQWYENYQQTENDFYQGDRDSINRSAERSLSAIRDRIRPKVRMRLMYRWLAAASVLIAIAIGTVILSTRKEVLKFTVIKTGTRQIRNIKLPDGTEVWLNAGGSLRYSSAYNRKDRQIDLDGEAYFDVAADRNKPFVVHSGKLYTRVLGTAFSISAYPQALIHNITVVKGKVEVSSGTKIVTDLLPNQGLDYTVDRETVSLVTTNAEKTASWMNGKLEYVEMTMQDIAIHLQEWYGVKFIVKGDSLKHKRFTASFNNHISLDDLLSVMQEVSHAGYRFDKPANTVTIYQ